jgi:hypothetical protein
LQYLLQSCSRGGGGNNGGQLVSHTKSLQFRPIFQSHHPVAGERRGHRDRQEPGARTQAIIWSTGSGSKMCLFRAARPNCCIFLLCQDRPRTPRPHTCPRCRTSHCIFCARNMRMPALNSFYSSIVPPPPPCTAPIPLICFLIENNCV